MIWTPALIFAGEKRYYLVCATYLRVDRFPFLVGVDFVEGISSALVPLTIVIEAKLKSQKRKT